MAGPFPEEWMDSAWNKVLAHSGYSKHDTDTWRNKVLLHFTPVTSNDNFFFLLFSQLYSFA